MKTNKQMKKKITLVFVPENRRCRESPLASKPSGRAWLSPPGSEVVPLAAHCLAGLARYKRDHGNELALMQPARSGRGSVLALGPWPSYLAVQTPPLSARRAQKVHSTLEVTPLQVLYLGCQENPQAWAGMRGVHSQHFVCLFLQMLIPCRQQQKYWERLNQALLSSQSPRK